MARRTQTFDIYVGNLPIDANDKNVGKLFVSYGEIASVYVRADNKDPNSKFSFVRFLCEPDADRAAKEMNNMELEGRHISVKRCGTSTPKTGGALEKTGNQTRKGKGKKSGGRNSETESTDGSVQDPSERAGGDGAPRSEVLHPSFNPHPASLKETAMCTHVETPVSLWLQIVSDDNTKKIFNITEQLSTLCPAAPKLTGQPDMNKVYACNFSEDGMWYRCMVRNSLGTDRFKIQYIDYGNTEEVTLGSLVEIPQNVAAMKGLAQKIVLHNTLPKDLSDKNAVQYLKSLTDGQMVQLIKTRPLTDGTGFFGHLIVNGQSINDAVIQAGHAYKRPQMDKSGGRDQQPNTKPFSNPPSLLCAPGTPPLIGGGDASMNPMMNKHPGTPAMVDTAAMQPGPAMMGTTMFGGRERSMRSPNDATGGNRQMKSMGQSNEPSGKEKELQAELTKKRREFERVRNEKDAARLEVEYMKSKVKTLQDEFSMTAAKMAEDTVAKRISSLVSLASRVRQLREQFPTGRQCLLEEAINLCQSPDRVDNSSLTSMAAVGSSLNTYKAAQKEISSCKDQPELSNLIASRDDARRDLYLKLTVCITELEKMPLEKRTASVQDIQMRLVNTYAQFLKFHIHDCPSMENLVPGFKNWKSKKDLEYADVRTATNFSEEALQTALSNVKQCVSVSSTEGTEKSDVDLDDLMKTYAHSLQREINVTDTEHSKDSSLIAAVIASVRRELTTEISMLENFRGLHREFTSLKSVIEPWLERKPALTDIQENRKTLRSLKSKLRHLMADKQDLEESGDEEELLTIKDEEVKVRNLIQETLVKSDELSNEVAKLADTNFPELILQFPDLGIDMQLTYSGLIKSNRDIDHYTLTPGLKPGTHRSTFNGVPVLIQEFHIGDTEHRSKEEFIKQTISFNGTSGDIQAIFFSKSERLAYIQSLWRDGKLLESFVQDHTLTAPEIQKVSLGVVQAVCDLHRRNFVHGEINPLNIVVHEGCDVTLLVPDFSKSLAERINKRYTTENGLVFQTPELGYTSAEAVGPAADVYNLVLLMFWFHCLSVKMSQRSDGTPETKIPNTDVSLQRLFDRVISGRSAAGMQAEQLLQLDYFRKTILTEDHAPPIPPESTVAHSTVGPSGVAQSVGANSPGALSMVVQQLQTSVPVKEQVIPQPNQQMEIGVFNMKDVIGGEEVMAAQVDTDDSWTTKSSSSGSRDSPLEAVIGSSKMAGEMINTGTVADNVLQEDIQPAVIGDVFSQAAEEGMFSQGGGDVCQTDAAFFCRAAGDMDFGAGVGGDIFSQAGDSPFMVFDNAKDLKKGRSPEPTGDGLELSETVKSVLNGVGELTIDSENKSNGDINASGSTAVSKDIEDDGDVDDGIREHGMTEKEMVDLIGSFANTTNFLTTSIEHGNSLGAAENTDSCKERIKVDKTSSMVDNSVPISTDDHISTQLFKNKDGTSTQSQEHMSPRKFLQNLKTLQGLFSKRPTVAAHKLMPSSTSTHISTNTDVKIQVSPKRDISEISSTEAIDSKIDVVVPKIDDVASKIVSIASKTVTSDTDKIGSKTDRIAPNTTLIANTMPKTDMITSKTDSIVLKTDTVAAKTDIVALKTGTVASKAGTLASKADTVALKTDTVAPKSDTVAHKTDTVSPKTDTVAPKTDTVAPKTDTVASKTDTVASKTDKVAPKTDIVVLKTGTVASKAGTLASKADTVALKTDTVAPKSYTVAHKTDTVSPKTDTVASKTDTVASKTDKVAPKTDIVVLKTGTVASKAGTLASKADTVALKTDTVAPKSDTVAPKTDTVAPKTDTVASKTDTVASKTDKVAPKTDTVATKTDTIASKTNTVDPKTNTVAPKTYTVAPKTDTVAPKTNTVAPKTVTVASKTDTVASKTDKVAPKTDTVATKTDAVVSKTDKVAPKTDTVATKTDTVASKTNTVAPKTDTVASKTNTVAPPKTNTVAPPKTNTVAPPKTNTVAPKANTVASKTDTVAPKTDTVAPKTDTVAPKTDTVAPKTDTVAPKTDIVAPKTDTLAPKTDIVAPKTDTVAPRTDTVASNAIASIIDTIASKIDTVFFVADLTVPKTDAIASKTDTIASGILVSSDITQKPTTMDVSTQSSPNLAGGILEPSEADPIASDPETPPMPSFSLTHILNMMKEGK